MLKASITNVSRSSNGTKPTVATGLANERKFGLVDYTDAKRETSKIEKENKYRKV